MENTRRTRTRADQHKCLPHLAYINPTLLFIEYFNFGFSVNNSKTKTNSKFEKNLFISL